MELLRDLPLSLLPVRRIMLAVVEVLLLSSLAPIEVVEDVVGGVAVSIVVLLVVNKVVLFVAVVSGRDNLSVRRLRRNVGVIELTPVLFSSPPPPSVGGSTPPGNVEDDMADCDGDCIGDDIEEDERADPPNEVRSLPRLERRMRNGLSTLVCSCCSSCCSPPLSSDGKRACDSSVSDDRRSALRCRELNVEDGTSGVTAAPVDEDDVDDDGGGGARLF